MKLNLKLEIENLYSGDGFTRTEEIKEIKLTRNKSKKTTKNTTGVSSESGVEEQQYETKQEAISTFERDKDNNPLYRLGGIHGKLWGHLRAIGKTLVDLGTEGFESKAAVDRMMLSINVSPPMVAIKKYDAIKVAVIPQKLNTIGNSMRFFKYDYIPNCFVDLEISFPDAYKSMILKILENVSNYAGLNKRRAIITILNKEDIFNGK